jgi:hypothetical protein
MSAFLKERPNSAWRRNTRAELLATNFHFTTPHADSSRLMQNMSITEESGWAASAIQRSQSSSDAKVGPLCIGWHRSALGPVAMQTATMKITAVTWTF